MRQKYSILISLNLLVFFLFVNTSFTKEKSIKHNLLFEYDNEAAVALRMGMDSSATDYWDKDLEQDLPPLSPPEGVIPTFFVLDTATKQNKLSQIDYKLYQEGLTKKNYIVRLLGNPQVNYKLIVPFLPDEVDSLIVKDRISGNFLRWKVTQSNKDTVISNLYTQFEIDVFYNTISLSINKEIEKNNIISEEMNYLYSNILLKNNQIEILDYNINLLAIYDINGKIIKNYEDNNFNLNNNIDNSIINLENNNSKLIFIHVEINNKRHYLKFINL